jgi:DNA mismatch repair protein MutS
MAATERGGEVVFLHKLQKGTATKSYGIAVARLAGLPAPVIERARDVLSKLEKYELAVFSDEKRNGVGAAAARAKIAQVSLFAVNNESVVDELRNLDLESLTPDDSKAFLEELKRKVI